MASVTEREKEREKEPPRPPPSGSGSGDHPHNHSQSHPHNPHHGSAGSGSSPSSASSSVARELRAAAKSFAPLKVKVELGTTAGSNDANANTNTTSPTGGTGDVGSESARTVGAAATGRGDKKKIAKGQSSASLEGANSTAGEAAFAAPRRTDSSGEAIRRKKKISLKVLDLSSIRLQDSAPDFLRSSRGKAGDGDGDTASSSADSQDPPFRPVGLKLPGKVTETQQASDAVALLREGRRCRPSQGWKEMKVSSSLVASTAHTLVPDSTSSSSSVTMARNGDDSTSVFMCHAVGVPAEPAEVLAFLRNFEESGKIVEPLLIRQQSRIICDIDPGHRIYMVQHDTSLTRRTRSLVFLESVVHGPFQSGSDDGTIVILQRSVDLDGSDAPSTKGVRAILLLGAIILSPSKLQRGWTDVGFVAQLDPKVSVPSNKLVRRAKKDHVKVPVRVLAHFSALEAAGLDLKHKRRKQRTKKSQDTAGGAEKLRASRRMLSYVPYCVAQHMYQTSSADLGPISCPLVVPLQGTLLFLDISGYTQLTEMVTITVAEQKKRTVGAEIVRDVLCEYFTLLVDCMRGFGGDVLKFAGDALLVLFSDQNGDVQTSMRNAVACALAACTIEYVPSQSVSLRLAHGDVDALSSVTLTNRVAIARGQLAGLYAGSAQRVEFMLTGEALLQVDPAITAAPTKSVVCSPEAWKVCNEFSLCSGVPVEATTECVLVQSMNANNEGEASTGLRVSRDSALPVDLEDVDVDPESFNDPHTWRSCNSATPLWCSACQGFILHETGVQCGVCLASRHDDCEISSASCTPGPALTPVDSSENLNVDQVASEIYRFVPEPVRDYEISLQRSGAASPSGFDAQIRTATVLFVSLNSVHAEASDVAEKMQTCMEVLLSVLTKYHGVLRQAILDDKGPVAIGVFGLPPVVADIPGCEVLSAVEIATLLRKAKLECTIGIATGRVFCGNVGSSLRQEYAVVGDVVNLSARLMGAAKRECPEKHGRLSILCDETTHSLAVAAGVQFDKNMWIRVKGKSKKLRVFQPKMLQDSLKAKGTGRRHATTSFDQFSQGTLGRSRSNSGSRDKSSRTSRRTPRVETATADSPTIPTPSEPRITGDPVKPSESTVVSSAGSSSSLAVSTEVNMQDGDDDLQADTLYFGDSVQFCGRTRELGLLQKIFSEFSEADCESTCVLIEGEQGFGKSSLIAGFLSGQMTKLEALGTSFVGLYCSQLNENTPYKMIRDFFDATIPGTPEERRRRALELFDISAVHGIAALEHRSPDHGENGPTAPSAASLDSTKHHDHADTHDHELRDLAPLLAVVGLPFENTDLIDHLDSSFRAKALRKLVLALILGMTVHCDGIPEKKLLIVCEDAHWMDHESVSAFSDALKFSVSDRDIRPPLFVIMSMRPSDRLAQSQQKAFRELRSQAASHTIIIADMLDEDIVDLAHHLSSAFVLDVLLHRDESELAFVDPAVLSLIEEIALGQGWRLTNKSWDTIPSSGAERCYQLVRSRVEISQEVRDAILGKSGGSPLFCVEFVRHLMQSGFLKFQACGPTGAQRVRLELVDGAATLAKMQEVPLSLEKLVVSRIDGLPPSAQLVLKTASVFGAEFKAFPDLVAVLPKDILSGDEQNQRSQLFRILRHTLSEFVISTNSEAPSLEVATSYKFSHAVIREVTYDLLTSQLRRELHKQVALMYEGLPRAQQPRPEIMAFHWRRAGNGRRACLYYAAAARHAHKNDAKIDAKFWVDNYFAVEDCEPELTGMEQAPMRFLRGKLLRSAGDAAAAANSFMKCVETVLPPGLKLGQHIVSSSFEQLVEEGQRSCQEASDSVKDDPTTIKVPHDDRYVSANREKIHDLNSCCTVLLFEDQHPVVRRRRAFAAVVQALAFLGSDLMLAAFKSAQFAHEVPVDVYEASREYFSFSLAKSSVIRPTITRQQTGSTAELSRRKNAPKPAAAPSVEYANTFCFLTFLLIRCAILSANMSSLAAAYGAARFLPGKLGEDFGDKLRSLVESYPHLRHTHVVWHDLSVRWFQGHNDTNPDVAALAESVVSSCLEAHDSGHAENLLIRVALWHMYGARRQEAMHAAKRCAETAQRRTQRAHQEVGHRLEVLTLLRHGAFARGLELDKVARHNGLLSMNAVVSAHAGVRSLFLAVVAALAARDEPAPVESASKVAPVAPEILVTGVPGGDQPKVTKTRHRRTPSGQLVGTEEWEQAAERIKNGLVRSASSDVSPIPIKSDSRDLPSPDAILQAATALPHLGYLGAPSLAVAADVCIVSALDCWSHKKATDAAVNTALRTIVSRISETRSLFSAMSMNLGCLEPLVALLGGWALWLEASPVAPSIIFKDKVILRELRAPATVLAEWQRGLEICSKIFSPLEHAQLLLSYGFFSGVEGSQALVLQGRELMETCGLLWIVNKYFLAST